MTLEELIAKVDAAGFRVANLFQLEDGGWQANVYMPEHRYEFAKGENAVAALREAVALALGERRAKAAESNKLNTITLEDIGL